MDYSGIQKQYFGTKKRKAFIFFLQQPAINFSSVLGEIVTYVVIVVLTKIMRLGEVFGLESHSAAQTLFPHISCVNSRYFPSSTERVLRVK